MRKLIVSAFAAAALLGSGFVAADDSGNYYGKAIIKMKAEVKERCNFTKGSMHQKIDFGKYDYKHGNWAERDITVRCKAQKRRHGASFTIKSGSLFEKEGRVALKQKHGHRKLALNLFCDLQTFNPGTLRTETTGMNGKKTLTLGFDLLKGQHVAAGEYEGKVLVSFAH